MSRNRKTLLAASLFAVLASCFLIGTESYAQACAEQLETAKEERSDPVLESGPGLDTADQHLAAAEEAMKSGDEAKCMQEVEEALQFIRMERRKHN